MSDPAKRAAELEKKLLADDDTAKKNDDFQSEVMDAIGKIADAVGGLGKRMDAFEEKPKPAPPRRPAADFSTIEKDDTDIEFDQLPPEEQETLINEQYARRPGEARPVVADAARQNWNQAVRADTHYDRETRRHALHLSVQARADEVFREFGLKAPPPMAGERIQPYRTRLLKHLVRFSPAYKGVDLTNVRDPAAFAVCEKQIFADALAESKKPTNLAPGELRMVEKKDGVHIRREFFGQPSTWMNNFAGPVQMRGTGKWAHQDQRG